ncbi:MAG: DUF4197 domain-containing protein [Betaproteobacteria bacterium]|nr:DUF4197 domain-containing protein [Betaproteobacteria bacterium]
MHPHKNKWLILSITTLSLSTAMPAFAFDLGTLQNQLSGALQNTLPTAPQTTAPTRNTQNVSGNTPALAALSQSEVGKGLKAALLQGVDTAVSTLGRTGGFNDSPKWHIPLPPALDKASNLMQMAGMGSQADALDASINHAAELAVPEAKTQLINAVKGMSLSDAKAILTGGNQSATDYFKRKTQLPLTQKFLPIVQQSMVKVGVAKTYDRYAQEAAQFGLIKPDQSSIETYVTQQALNRLYQAIGEEEQAIRANPIGTGSALISKVFGAL